MNQLRAVLKWLASWRKRDWNASDYPLRYLEQLPPAELELPRFELPRWSVQVVNWWQMGGLGETRAEALADLESRLSKLREGGTQLPRPGRGLALEFGPTTEIQGYEKLARDLFAQFLDLDYDACFVSDESSLYDFVVSDAEAQQLIARIEDHYHVTLPERESLLISEMLQVIADAGGAV